jgi:hypothetical protein
MAESYKEGGLNRHKYVIHKKRVLGFLKGEEFEPCDDCTAEETTAVNAKGHCPSST